jgi:hypothetical protein
VLRVLAGVGLIGGLLVYWVAPTPDGVKLLPGTPHLIAKKVSFQVRSVPSGASVSIQGKPRGKTPFELELELGDASVPVRFELAGHHSVVRDVTPSSPGRLDVTLPKK